MGSVSPESTQHVEQREFLMRSQGNTEYHSPNDGFTSSKSATSTIREKANSKTDAQLSEKSGWPLEPRKLRERDRFHWLSVLCDFLVTLLPVAFLGMRARPFDFIWSNLVPIQSSESQLYTWMESLDPNLGRISSRRASMGQRRFRSSLPPSWPE